ncbi:MAG: type IV pilus modification PilV family protein [Gemmatimonadaceae bacterium]
MNNRIWSDARPRNGFTIIELIVAIVILAIGVLGLTGTSAVVSRTLGQGTQHAKAATLAQTRFETMRSSRCPVSSGNAVAGKFTEKWTTVSTLGGSNLRFSEVIDSVFYSVGGKAKKQAFRSVVQCLP